MSTDYFNTTPLFYNLIITSLIETFKAFKFTEYEWIYHELNKLKVSDSEKIARPLQKDLYALQNTLCKKTHIPNPDQKALFSACSFALSRLSDLYPALNEEDGYGNLIDELPSHQLVKLSSGHHENVNWLIAELTIAGVVEVRKLNKCLGQQHVLQCKEPIHNPYTKRSLTYRDMIALLAAATEQQIKLPQELFLLEEDFTNKKHICIGSKRARSNAQASVTQAAAKSLNLKLLYLEDIAFYNYLLSTNPHETLDTLLRFTSKEISDVRESAHTQLTTIKEITLPFLQAGSLKANEINRVSLISANRLNLARIIESITIPELIKLHGKTLHTQDLCKFNQINMNMYRAIFKAYPDLPEKDDLSPDELAILGKATICCLNFLNQARMNINKLNLQDIKSLLDSEEYQAFYTILRDLIWEDASIQKRLHTTLFKPNTHIMIDFVAIDRNAVLNQLLKKFQKTYKDIPLDGNNLQNSINRLSANLNSEALMDKIDEGKITFKAWLSLSDETRETLENNKADRESNASSVHANNHQTKSANNISIEESIPRSSNRQPPKHSPQYIPAAQPHPARTTHGREEKRDGRQVLKPYSPPESISNSSKHTSSGSSNHGKYTFFTDPHKRHHTKKPVIVIDTPFEGIRIERHRR
jgi:hypothetical protein